MKSPVLLAGGALPMLISAAAAPPFRRQDSSSACAEVAEAWQDARSGSGNSTAEVRPSVAYDCLRSIPVDTELDLGLVDFLTPWLEFQSTIGILADPPSGYMYPGVDIFAGLESIADKLNDDEYDNQYEFATDIYRLINVKPREGHLSYRPALMNIIRFETPARFISISEDGTSLPSVYLYDDYVESIDAGYEASSVETFMGEPIAEWIQQRAVDNDRNQDPDASYNAQLFSTALNVIGITSEAGRYLHGNLSDESTLEFTNGTELTMNNTAFILGNWTGIRSGQDVHERFEVPDSSGRPQSDPTTERDGAVSQGEPPFSDLEGYPTPFVSHPDDYVTGYMFNHSTLEGTAVLAVKSFLSPSGEQSTEDDFLLFTEVVNRFVRTNRQMGNERLILDFQGNGGGSLANLLALQNVLFPQEDIWLPFRARGNPALDWMGETSEQTGRVMLPDFDIESSVDDELEEFSGWDDFYDLEEILGDEFTQIYQPVQIQMLRDYPTLVGLGDSEPWFDPSNTVIVTDGFCASACAIAVGLLNRVHGVRTVAMGGRPIEAPMQAIGGTKGGPVLTLEVAQLVFEELSRARSPPSDLDVTPFDERNSRNVLAGPPPSRSVVNSANVHHHEADNGTPLQFVYEAANCKLFHTWDTLTNLTRLWEAVARVEWDGAPCVAGSTANDDDTISDDMVDFSEDVVSQFTWADGPGDVSEAPPEGTPDSQFGGAGGLTVNLGMVTLGAGLAATAAMLFV